MNYKREDGRKFDDLRDAEAKVGVIKKAKGSAMFRIGKTTAYAAVYGPRELHPKFMQDPETGKLRCNYNMMPFSGSGESSRPGPNRRAKEISMVTESALIPVMDLKDFPNTVVDVFIEITQADAGTRCAGICAASMALADAGFKMKDLPVAVACGFVENTVIADLNYNEDSYDPGVDVPMCILPRTGEITLLQTDGIIPKEKYLEVIELGKKSAAKISKIMKAALRAKFEEDSQ